MTDKRCPVCWRPIPIADDWRFARHRDKAGNSCPMSKRYVERSERDNTESLPRKEPESYAQRLHANEPRHLVK